MFSGGLPAGTYGVSFSGDTPICAFGVWYPKGYQVGTGSLTGILEMSATAFSVEDILRLAAKDPVQERWYGIWRDSHDTWWLETSRYIKKFEDAVHFAHELGQQEIYDWEHKTCVPVGVV